MIAIKQKYSDLKLCEFAVDTIREAAEKGKANLYGADMRGANLRGADLYEADLGGNKGKLNADGYFALGPLGSRKDHLHALCTDTGIWIIAGCFFDSIEAFRAKVVETHGDNNFAFEYIGACNLIEHHFNNQEVLK